MKEKNYNQEQARNLLNQEINRLRLLEGMDVKSIIEKLGVSRSRVYKALTTFEQENPQQVELMKKRGADFYEEMVAFGKEVYGIDLKKAGTK